MSTGLTGTAVGSAARAPHRGDEHAVQGGPAPLLSLRGLSKTFGSAKALDDVDLTVQVGEVHALLGENGSGKSTLIKILNGFHAPDPGATLTIAGREVPLPVPPGRFREHGVAFVHQDLALIPDLTVVENLRVADVVAGPVRWISWAAERRAATETFARFGLDIDPAAPVQRLSETERALLAIVRATEELRSARSDSGAGLLVLDEPTVFLPREGADLLFRIVRDLVADGRTSVLFVSHDLDEVLEHTDRVTVLRDGRVRSTVTTSDISRPELVELIVGRSLVEALEGAGDHKASFVRHAIVSGLSAGPLVDIDFVVGRGEVVGVTGLAGSGYEDVLPAMYGARPGADGTLVLPSAGLYLDELTPAEAIRSGVVFIPADRARDGSIGELSVLDNMTLPVLSSYRSILGLRTRALQVLGDQLTEHYDVRPRDSSATYGTLSGGNQQKALLAKWLQTGPELVLLHEPTQGVDVGARAHIFSLLSEAASAGTCVVVASSDYEQLAAICDRVLVFARGRVVDELSGSAVTKDRITDRVLGSMTLLESMTEVSA
jgi:ribose transport system ATP-binding protein